MKRYIFQYTPEPTRTGIIYRPKAKILLQSAESDWYSFWVYIDSGADLSLFTKTDAKLIGLNLPRRIPTHNWDRKNLNPSLYAQG